ncbi:MAG: DEAD/DEAH box helicase family protein [Oscillospiraceae bacterium]|nr:DEAD/DEAH box helicase family protein [Oscillospiraceae bacterium]
MRNNNNYCRLLKKFKTKIPVYRENPELFAMEVCGFECDAWQKAVFSDIAKYPKVTVRSGQGVGKTGCEAVLCLWFLSCFPYSRVVATAPTKQQLNDVLWAEVSKWQSKSPLLKAILKWTKTKVSVKNYEERWFATARTATKPENMQGFHEDNMLFIVDEASGVADPIMEAILGTLSGSNNKLLMCGNPTRTSGTFYDSHTNDRALYKCHKVSSRDSSRTNKDNIKSLENKYGSQSNVVRIRVDGEFPKQEDDVFISIEYIEKSVMTDFTEPDIPDLIHIGCDVARFGDDKTIVGYKVNEKMEIFEKRQGQDTMKTADDIVRCAEMLLRKYKKYSRPIPVKVDDGGVGGGVVDRLRQMQKLNPKKFSWMVVFPVKFGLRINHPYYHDSTTYMMGVVRSMLSPHDEDGREKPVELILPDDNDLIAQLSQRKYFMTDMSKQCVESKKAIKKRGGHSPDEADCVLLCCLPVKIKKKREGR